MIEYEVLFYESREGKCPVDGFLGSLPAKVKGKLEKWIEQLELYGPSLPRPFADTLRGKIRELRLRFGPSHYRFLYFFLGKKIIMTHGFVKKSDKVPEEEIVRAIRMMDDFVRRWNQGGIEL